MSSQNLNWGTLMQILSCFKISSNRLLALQCEVMARTNNTTQNSPKFHFQCKIHFFLGRALLSPSLVHLPFRPPQNSSQIYASAWLFVSPMYYFCLTHTCLVMAALRSRCGHYIFTLWFLLSSFFFIPRLISAAADWMSTILPHMVWP